MRQRRGAPGGDLGVELGLAVLLVGELLGVERLELVGILLGLTGAGGHRFRKFRERPSRAD